jgi:hypothetical protein
LIDSSAAGERVADIFFSYSRKDKERVGLVRDALAEMGFEVFWDQETPSGSDWDTWIRGELAKSKCAVVFWSATSTVSDNVRHEAVVAKEQRKLMSVFLDQLPAGNLPMGFYSQQAADLSKWNGDREDTEWRKFRREFEAKLMPRWVQQKLNDVDAELEGERAKRETAEAHEKSLRAQISKEAKTQQGLKGERDRALTEVNELREVVEERDQALQAQIAKQVETEQGLKTERDRACAEVAEFKAAVERLSRAPHVEPHSTKELTKRWLTPISVGAILLAAAVSAVLVSWPQGSKTDGEAEAKAVQAAALAKSEQARQTAEAKADDADKARQAAVAKADEADRSRLAALAKADDADRARRAAEAKAAGAEIARTAAETKLAQAIASVARNAFVRKASTEARGQPISVSALFPYGASMPNIEACEQSCARNSSCNVYTYDNHKGSCFMYSGADLIANEAYDSGVRNK